MNDHPDQIFTPTTLGSLSLKNRIIKAGCFEGMSPGGVPSDALMEHHREIARGGTAMTTVAYCSVSPDGRTYETQLWMRDEIVPSLRELTDAVHAEGAAASIQLGHCGYFASPKVVGGPVFGPSRQFNLYGLSFCQEMDEGQIETVIDNFARSAALSAEAGFDAVELHFGHGYLVSQFLSPYTNHRTDRWGGSLENRARLGRRILESVRSRVDIPVIAKINLTDGIKGGLTLEESTRAAAIFAEAGADALVLSGGFVSKSSLFMLRGEVPTWEMAKGQKGILRKLGLMLFGNLIVKKYPFEPMFFFEEARKIRAAVDIPLVLIGGILSRDHIETALDNGFDCVALGRPLIRDPHFPRKLLSGELTESDCDHCNRCIAAMDRGGVRCEC